MRENQNTYSIDVSAINDFDPGWNITATVDKYIARMYKNTTDDGRIDFNHSFVYKAHTDEDGKENSSLRLAISKTATFIAFQEKVPIHRRKSME